MNPRTLLTIAAALLFFGVFQACTSPQELVESGNYDQAIEMAVRKLAGKKNKKVKFIKFTKHTRPNFLWKLCKTLEKH